jgi:hypothetical protein
MLIGRRHLGVQAVCFGRLRTHVMHIRRVGETAEVGGWVRTGMVQGG